MNKICIFEQIKLKTVCQISVIIGHMISRCRLDLLKIRLYNIIKYNLILNFKNLNQVQKHTCSTESTAICERYLHSKASSLADGASRTQIWRSSNIFSSTFHDYFMSDIPRLQKRNLWNLIFYKSWLEIRRYLEEF